MKDAEMKVIRFGSNDVIATNGFSCSKHDNAQHVLVNEILGNGNVSVTCYDHNDEGWHDSTKEYSDASSFPWYPGEGGDDPTEVGAYYYWSTAGERFIKCTQ